MVRSPDGESRSYAIGQLSIQRAAVWILQRYYTEFAIYNPYLEQLPVSKSKKSTTSFKFYDVDGFANTSLPVREAKHIIDRKSTTTGIRAVSCRLLATYRDYFYFTY